MYRLQKIVVLFFLFYHGVAVQSKLPAYNIKVYTNGYKGWLGTSSHRDFFFLHKDTTLTIGPDTTGAYYLNTGASIGDCNALQTSYIYLYFNALGLLTSACPTSSATISQDQKSIILHTTPVTIDPGRFNREWYPSFGVEMNVRPGFYYKKRTVRLIKGLTYAIDNSHSFMYDSCKCVLQADTCQPTLKGYHASYFYFTVLSNGQIKLSDANRISASICHRGLRFKTVLVRIDPAEISGGAVLWIPKPNSQKILIPTKKVFPFIRGTVNYVKWMDTKGKQNVFNFLPM